MPWQQCRSKASAAKKTIARRSDSKVAALAVVLGKAMWSPLLPICFPGSSVGLACAARATRGIEATHSLFEDGADLLTLALGDLSWCHLCDLHFYSKPLALLSDTLPGITAPVRSKSVLWPNRGSSDLFFSLCLILNKEEKSFACVVSNVKKKVAIINEITAFPSCKLP